MIVGITVGFCEGLLVPPIHVGNDVNGARLGVSVGVFDGIEEGIDEGSSVGIDKGTKDGCLVGTIDGCPEG